MCQRGAPEVVVEDVRERRGGQEVLVLEDGAAASNNSLSSYKKLIKFKNIKEFF